MAARRCLASASRDIERSGAQELGDFMNRTLSSVHVNVTQGNLFQMDVSYRGYAASPLLGDRAHAARPSAILNEMPRSLVQRIRTIPLFAADKQAGFGYFKNFGRTRRQGLELGLSGIVGQFNLGVQFTFYAPGTPSDDLAWTALRVRQITGQQGQRLVPACNPSHLLLKK